MKNLQILLVVFVFASCKNASRNQAKVDRKPAILIKSSDTIVKSALASNVEYIDFNEVRINDKLPIISKTNLLYAVLGKPDSIITPHKEDVCVSYYDKPFKEAYIKNSAIEIYGDTAVVSTLDFRNNSALEFTTKTIRLNHNTTLIELQKIFPKTVISELNVDEIGKTASIKLPVSKQITDYYWLLFFKNKKLIRIDLYTPC